MAKKRSGVLDRLLKELTPEKREELRLKRIAEIKSLSVEYQLGQFVGEKIVRLFLPSLEIDSFETRNLIKVEPAEKAEAKRLSDAWWKKHQVSKEESDAEWIALRSYHKQIEDKYLPKELICHIEPVNYTNEEEFKSGLINALWHSDISHYNCSKTSDVDVKLDDDGFFTVVTLHR